MSFDIYGQPLRRGHCEVHPHVHEEYPCSVCFAESRAREQEGRCMGGCESEHYLGQAQEHIEHLNARIAELYEELLDRYTQTRCGCGHPACKRCRDDRDTEAVLARARGEGEA